MNVVVALTAGIAVFLVVSGGSRSVLADRLGQYLLPAETRDADMIPDKLALPWLTSVIVGGFVGALAAQGDLFLAGPGRSVPALVGLGAAAGYFLWSARRTSLQERRSRQLRFELPIVADAIALHIVSGASVSAAIRAVVLELDGVSVDELAAVVASEDAGEGLTPSLLVAARTTAHPDGRRLFDLLAHAHESGGRLGIMLGELSEDLRAGIERDLSSEGGRRAVASYGPVLALMIPVALLFLLYPTLLGLQSLSNGP